LTAVAVVGILAAAFIPQESGLSLAKVFTVAARFEALTWLGLLIGMFFKYVTETTEAGVWLFGRLHGAAFLFYFFTSIVSAIRLRWPWWCGVLAVLAAIPPLVTYPLELWFRRRGILKGK
jgi:integral membrane protein